MLLKNVITSEDLIRRQINLGLILMALNLDVQICMEVAEIHVLNNNS